MDKKEQRWIRFGLGAVLSVVGLLLVLKGIDWPALSQVLRQVHLGWLLAAVAVEMFTILVNAIRWRWLFWPHYRPPIGRLFGILNVAQLANTVLPGRLGLPLRVLLVGEGGQVSRSTSLTTLAVEKMLEAATLLPIGIVLFLALDLPDWLRLSIIFSGCLLLALLLIVATGLRWGDRFLAWMSGWAAGWLASFGRALLDGLDSLRSVRVGWRLWGWSVVYWAAVAAALGLVIRAVGLDVPPIAVLFLFFVLQIGVRLPSSPGGIGVLDYLGVFSLTIFGVDKTSALGAMVVLRLVFYLPPSLVGVGYLVWTSTGLAQLRQAALTLQEK